MTDHIPSSDMLPSRIFEDDILPVSEGRELIAAGLVLKPVHDLKDVLVGYRPFRAS